MSEIETRVNTLAGSAAKVAKAPPLATFNEAYNAIRQVHNRLVNLIAALQGEDCATPEEAPSSQNMYALLANMPDQIHTECQGLNDKITELERILLN